MASPVRVPMMMVSLLVVLCILPVCSGAADGKHQHQEFITALHKQMDHCVCMPALQFANRWIAHQHCINTTTSEQLLDQCLLDADQSHPRLPVEELGFVLSIAIKKWKRSSDVTPGMLQQICDAAECGNIPCPECPECAKCPKCPKCPECKPKVDIITPLWSLAIADSDIEITVDEEFALTKDVTVMTNKELQSAVLLLRKHCQKSASPRAFNWLADQGQRMWATWLSPHSYFAGEAGKHLVDSESFAPVVIAAITIVAVTYVVMACTRSWMAIAAKERADMAERQMRMTQRTEDREAFAAMLAALHLQRARPSHRLRISHTPTE